jgi:hypothetical protein
MLPVIRTSAQTLLAASLLLTASLAAQDRPTSPESFFGHPIGADYVLPNYQQLVAYWTRLAGESERLRLVEIGRTAEGRPQYMAIVTSPQNHARLDRYREISRRLALAEGLTEADARALAAEGRAVVWIDGGLHATEVLGAQQLMETVWQLVGMNDPETLRILDDVIVLAVHANPDGHDLVSDWYMREPDPLRRSTARLPVLYQKYVGHDNNRDFYASTQAETRNMNRILYREWFPQIVYNHHQTAPRGTVMFAPPFRDPFNFVYDPLIITSLDLIGAAMHNRFVAEDKGGTTMRRGAGFSTWWNGGLRTTVYFHNMLGLLTETIGHPTPMEVPFLPERQLPHGDLPLPIEPQRWHFRQSVDYSVTANRAVLDLASRHREQFLLNIWRMGRNSIERGSRDHWTVYPRRIAAIRQQLAEGTTSEGDGATATPAADLSGPEALALLRTPETRDARGYILAADQPDFPTATRFVNMLMETGVIVHRARSAFRVGGRTYPAGSYVVRADQAFRPHVLDMFEPQDHPDDFQYEGGPPIPPYDNAGWTPAFQMGVDFDRVVEGFEGPFERLEGPVRPPPGRIVGAARPAGYLLDRRVNDAAIAVNRLLAAGHAVYWLTRPQRADGRTHEAGTFYVPARPGVATLLQPIAAELGVDFIGVSGRPGGTALRVQAPRIALWDRYGGSMPSGWTRWLLEQFEFDFDVVFPPDLDAGALRDRYDVIIFPDGAVPERDRAAPRRAGAERTDPTAPTDDQIPEEYRRRLGAVTPERTVPRLREFLEQGGTILAVGSSTNLAVHLDLPVRNALVAVDAQGVEQPLGREQYYIPGSILEARLDTSRPIAHGMPERVDVVFDNSPVFRLGGGGVRRVGWFDGPEPLRSGWAWGQHHLEGGVAIAEAEVGAGRLFLFGPQITFRAQPHGTFKLLFNGLYLGAAREQRID